MLPFQAVSSVLSVLKSSDKLASPFSVLCVAVNPIVNCLYARQVSVPVQLSLSSNVGFAIDALLKQH